MDMNEHLDDIEVEAREAWRQALLKQMTQAKKLKEDYDKATAKVEARVKRAKMAVNKAKEEIDELAAAAHKIHGDLARANSAEDLLIAEFVPHEIQSAEAKAAALSSKKSRKLREAVGALAELQRVLDQKDPKKIDGTLRSPSGEALREDPNDPTSPRKRGKVKNPNRWVNKQQREVFMAEIERAKLEVAEAEMAANEAADAHAVAAEALRVAREEALRGE